MASAGGTPYFPPPPGQFGRLPPQPPFRPQQPAPPYTQQAYPPSPIGTAYTPTPSGGPVSGSYNAQQQPPLFAAPGEKPQQAHGHAPYGPIPGLVAGGAAPSPVAQSHPTPPPAIHTAGTWPQAAPAMTPGKVPLPPPGPPPAPAQHQQQSAGYAPSPPAYSAEYAPSPMSSVSSPVHGFSSALRPPMAPSSCVSPCDTPQTPFQLPYAQTFPVPGHPAQALASSPAPRIQSLQGSFAETPHKPDQGLAMASSTKISPQSVDEVRPTQTAYGGWPASLSMLDISRFLPNTPTSAVANTDHKPSQAAKQTVSAVISPFAEENGCHELAGEDMGPPAHIKPASQNTIAVAPEKVVDTTASVPPVIGSISGVGKEVTKHLNEIVSPKDLASTPQPVALSELPDNREPPQVHEVASNPKPQAVRLDSHNAQDLGPRRDAEPELWKRPYPPMRLHGTPSPVIFECQEERELDYTTRWYRLPDVPDFLACTLCHKMYIGNTAIESSFEAVELPRGRCYFNVPRLTRSLVPAACRSGDVQPIREFAKKRLQTQDCHGQGGVGTEAKVKWFKVQDTRLDWFAACEACHEDVVQGTPFRARFIAAPAQAEGEVWACDICIPYIKRALLRFSSQPGDRWDAFVEAANRRMHLPKCEGVPVEQAAEGQVMRWYRPTAAIPGDRAQELLLCEACFCDRVALTSLESGFELVSSRQHGTGSAGSGVLDFLVAHVRAAPATAMTCLGSMLPTTAALASAAAMQDLEILRTAARTIVASPPCTESGIVGGAWFILQENDGSPASPDFAICAACHAGWIETWGLAGFFTPLSGDGTARLCNLHPAHPRFQKLLPRLGEAVETGVWAPFPAAARVWADVPLCPRSNMAVGRRWWGHDDCTVCEECHLSFCAAVDGGAALAASMPLRGDVVADERMCCMYSPRMRRQWLLACEQGSPEGLVAFSRQRLAVYAQTIPQIKFLRGMQELQMVQAMHNGLMSTMYSGMASFREVAGTTDGHLHGNSTLGWHSTDEGATSAAFSQKMSAGMAASNAPWSQIIQLAALWDEWE